jgi:hypothetical protein
MTHYPASRLSQNPLGVEPKGFDSEERVTFTLSWMALEILPPHAAFRARSVSIEASCATV